MYGYHRDLHVLTHSFPTRRSSDLAKVLGEYDRLKAVASGKRISIFAKMTGRPAPKVQTIQADANDLKSARISEKTALEIADRTNKALENENQKIGRAHV